MESHVRILGVLYLISGGLFLLGALLLATTMTGVGLLAQDAGAFALLSGMGVAIAAVLALLGLPAMIEGWGLLRHRSWSRVLGLILGFVNLLNFPLGTILGAYSLWVLFQPETERLLEGGLARGPDRLHG